MIRLSPEQQRLEPLILLWLFSAAGYKSVNEVPAPKGSYASDQAKIIVTEILNRDFNLNAVDAAISSIQNLSTLRVRLPGHSSEYFRKQSPKAWAMYIADFCAKNAIYWDDVNTNRTTYEMDEYKRTLIGQQLLAGGCFLSQHMQNQSTQSTSTTRTASTRAAGQPPKNDYKAQGGKSGLIYDLKGTPGNKVFASGSEIFYITGDKTGSASKATVLIKPINSNGRRGNTNKVFFSASHGYDDCTCFFDHLQDAADFARSVSAANLDLKQNITNVHIAKKSTDKNGYFKVGTEFGDCLIMARKMNEDLEEACEDNIPEKKINYINDIDVYEQYFHMD